MIQLLKIGTVGTVGLMVIALVGGPLAMAKGQGSAKGGVGHGGGMPSGFSHGEKKGWKGESNPPGWSHGKKTGWHDKKLPPGLAKKAGNENQEVVEETEKLEEKEKNE